VRLQRVRRRRDVEIVLEQRLGRDDVHQLDVAARVTEPDPERIPPLGGRELLRGEELVRQRRVPQVEELLHRPGAAH
jgi:hypothetical protein